PATTGRSTRQTSLIRQRSSTVRRSRSKCSPVYREPRSWCTIAGREDFTITVLVRLIVLRYDKKIVTRGRTIYRLFTREMKELEKKLKVRGHCQLVLTQLKSARN